MQYAKQSVNTQFKPFCVKNNILIYFFRFHCNKLFSRRRFLFLVGVDHGICSGAGECTCSADWVGETCDEPCLNGSNIDGICVCDSACNHGVGCQLVCSGHGSCHNNTCQCDFFAGFHGAHCDIPGCPGWPELCDGHGTCNTAKRQCTCDPGFLGLGCETPNCPGEPDCNGVQATCVLVGEQDTPECTNCAYPYYGDGCQYK